MTTPRTTKDGDGYLNTGSEVTFDIVCFTCNSEGNNKKAEGYCLDCCEHLCTTCMKYHRRLSVTKHHKIIDKENMPGNQRILSASDICTERCKVHQDEIIKYFCTIHKVLGCSVCVTLKHKLCSDVTYIPEAAVDLSRSQDFKDFQSKLEKLIKNSEYITKATQSNIKLSADYRAKALQEIETYRQELNDALDKLKEELEQQSEEIEVNESEKMKSAADTSNQVLAKLQRTSSDIKELIDKKHYCKLFIDMKKAEDKLTGIQDKLPKAEEIFVSVVRFQPNLELQNLIERKDALGQLVVKSPSEMNATFLTDINVKCPENIKTCNVTSAALFSESKLVITDWGNMAVKLIDIKHNQLLCEYNTKKSPNDVVRVGQTHVAVTLPYAKKIQFLKSENGLSLDEEITFKSKCWYVACVDHKLIVSVSEPWEVRILNMAGEVLQSFATSSQGDRLFIRAPYLSVSPFNQAIYASDWDKNRVTMLDLDGKVRAVYEDADLTNSCYTAVDNTGMVYICGGNSNNVHLLTPDCRKVKILLTRRDGIRWPRGICFCKVTQRLYVSMDDSDIIKVFQLS